MEEQRGDHQEARRDAAEGGGGGGAKLGTGATVGEKREGRGMTGGGIEGEQRLEGRGGNERGSGGSGSGGGGGRRRKPAGLAGFKGDARATVNQELAMRQSYASQCKIEQSESFVSAKAV
ncbi:hypothetical protein Rs2_39224 [Raphanus sativus]|nr:hypothetical protein Rs2_39224 [Raphanus sativus]